MPGNYLMICVDGTGPYSEDQYDSDFQFSYLNQIGNHLGSRGKYYKGPGTAGQTTFLTALEAANYIVTRWSEDPSLQIYLAGYSRGGVAVMETAKLCEHWTLRVRERRNPSLPSSIPIKAMFLLDPVRGWDSGCSGHLSSNVAVAYVMWRDERIIWYDAPISPEEYASFRDWKDKGLVRTVFGFVDPDRYGRRFMGHASVSNLGGNSTTKLLRSIRIDGASHGAVGGLPWVERREDEMPCKTAGEVLKGWCALHGISAHLVDCSYSAANKAMIPALPEAAIRKYMRYKLSNAQKAAAEHKAFLEYKATYNMNYLD